MEGILTDLAVDATKSLVTMAASKAFEEIRLIWGFNDDLKRLKSRFVYTQKFLEDLGQGKHEQKSRLVNGWLQDVKEVAYSAENLMNDHAYEMLRRKLAFIKINRNTNNNRRPSFKKKWRSYIREPSRPPIVFRVRMTHRVKEILSMFDELDNKANKIGLNLVDLANQAVSVSASTSAVDTLFQIRERPPTQVFIGRDKDKEELVKIMLSFTTATQDTIPIIAIVGLGGLGKTTLAFKVKDEANFDGKRLWICVSENFNILMILKEMVEQVTGAKCDLNKEAIIDLLQQKLKGQKLFLVLDDVWNESQLLWDSFKSDLQRIGVATGSVMLITTRKERVVTAARASQSHKLKGLSDKDALHLLKQQVSFDPSFDEVVTRILKKCVGVPLAINAIGGILKSKDPSNWHQLETSDVWSIQQNDDDDNFIMPSLLLSYKHFNDVSLKQCFACCAIYPKDRVMEKGELIALWLAQGLVHYHDQDNSTTTMETIGEKYIDVLVNHSFLLLEDEDEVEVYRTKYKMHDLVHDLATHVLKKDLLVWEVGTNLNDVSHVRHLAVNFKDNDEGAPETVTLPKKEIRKLRTVIFRNYGVSMWKSLNGARYLCTLIMVDIGLEEVPPVIGQLVHLRYLDLSHNNRLKALPESICKLYQLQTLRLLGCVWCSVLPRELHKLGNLRHIPTEYPVLASKGLQELTNLQTLPPLKLRAEEGWKIDELGFLKQVKGEICIRGLNHVKNKEEARKADLGKKDKILLLILGWDDDREESNGLSNDEDVLEGLEPHPNIQSLRVVEYKGVKFPEWIMKMSVKELQTGYLTHLRSLTKVELSCCKNCQQLPSLGQLPNLKVLKLRNFDKVECIGDEFYKSSNNNCREHPSARDEDIIFRSLNTLRIEGFARLTTWAAPSSPEATTAFRSLQTLKVEHCPQLETTPYVPLTSLKHVDFRNVGVTHFDMVKKGSNGLIELKLCEIQKLRMLPEELSNCSNLQSLEIDDCENLECIPNGLTSLKTLKVGSCPSLSSIPDMEKLEGLKQLSLKDAGLLSTFSLRWIPSLHGLTKLYLNGLTEEWDISLISSLTSLTSLELRNCPNFKALTTQQQALPHTPLIGLEKSLEKLRLFNAGEMMMSAARSIPQLGRLWKLEIGGFKDEEEITKFVSQIKSTPHSHSHSLREVTLRGWPKVKKMPEQLQHLLPSSTLQELIIHTFDELEQLPDWIGNLSSLKTLWLTGCYKLKYLPSKQAMMHLSKLYILQCPELKERCEKHSNNENENENDNGPPHSESQWPNIINLD